MSDQFCNLSSDQRLQDMGLIEDYCMRFVNEEFVVYDKFRRAYVESIDTYDGDTEWTTNPDHARIFRGYEWAMVFARKGRQFILPHMLPFYP